jgi:hypothetical protein
MIAPNLCDKPDNPRNAINRWKSMENLTLQNHAKKPSLPEHSVIIPMLQSITRPLAGLTSIHNAYGELVLGRFFNKKLLFVSAPEHIEQIFSHEARGLMSRDFLYDAKKTFFGNGLINSQSEVWSKQRRLMQPCACTPHLGVVDTSDRRDRARRVHHRQGQHHHAEHVCHSPQCPALGTA